MPFVRLQGRNIDMTPVPLINAEGFRRREFHGPPDLPGKLLELRVVRRINADR